MSSKLKITLGLLILIAGFLLVRLGLFFTHSVKTATTANISNQVAGVSDENFAARDSDNDGIPDVNEAYYRTDPSNPDTDGDGFLDGEEIISNCSPTKPRPDDCLKRDGANTTNLTEEVTNLLAGGLYSGDLKNLATNQNFEKNLDLVSTRVYLDFYENFTDKIMSSDLKVSGDNAPAVVVSYLENLGNALSKTLLRPQEEQINEIKKGLNLLIISPKEKNQIFDDLRKLFSDNYFELLNISVPSDWTSLHLKLVSSISRFATTYEFIANPASDPIATILSFEKLVDEFYNAQSILNQIQIKAQPYDSN